MSRDVIDFVEAVLSGTCSPGDARKELKKRLQNAPIREKSRASCAIRLFQRLEDEMWEDSLVQLRQFILVYEQKVVLSERLANRMRGISGAFGVVIGKDLEADVLTEQQNVFPHQKQLQSIYAFEPRRRSQPKIGDGVLHNLTGHSFYQSLDQKLMVRAAMQMQPGETLLVCLPTGGGKSLIGHLPAFLETNKGTISHPYKETAGTTIVVVPTVSLAMDQWRAVHQYFDSALDEYSKPQVYSSDTSEQERETIHDALERGSLPLLFTSPESLLGGPLSKTVLRAARMGSIKRLVIDEAHIAIDWGNLFRTDFQLLAAYRKRLLEESQGQLKTLLLSATLTEWTTDMLKMLFSEPGKCTELRGDALRSEPMFLIDESRTEEERYSKILNSLNLFPRPMILYVSRRSHAHEWYTRMRQRGYRSVAMFTSKTQKEERKRLLDQWNDDKIDVMIATSAFGMGVDKANIRTILHCCMPESMNRFYQEVGRAGRDGVASVSLLSCVPRDRKIMRSTMRNAVITVEKLVARWQKLYQRAEPTEIADEVWLEGNVQPKHLEGTRSGKPNLNWNESLLLLLHRHQFLKILEVDTSQQGKNRLRVKLLDQDLLQDADQLMKRIRPDRDLERRRINLEMEMMEAIVDQRNEQCLSSLFLKMYPYAQRLCGGCPHCFAQDAGLTYHDSVFTMPSFAEQPTSQAELTGVLANFTMGFQEMMVTLSERPDLNKHRELFDVLVRSNVTTFLIPHLAPSDYRGIVEQTPTDELGTFYQLFASDEIRAASQLITGHVAVLYGSNMRENDSMYAWACAYRERHPQSVVVHMAPSDLLISREGKTLEHLLNTIPVEVDELISLQTDTYTLKFI